MSQTGQDGVSSAEICAGAAHLRRSMRFELVRSLTRSDLYQRFDRVEDLLTSSSSSEPDPIAHSGNRQRSRHLTAFDFISECRSSPVNDNEVQRSPTLSSSPHVPISRYCDAFVTNFSAVDFRVVGAWGVARDRTLNCAATASRVDVLRANYSALSPLSPFFPEGPPAGSVDDRLWIEFCISLQFVSAMPDMPVNLVE
ncbi:hypothetical protein EVAR_43068_1 [Eumeta japonica]|uniref:Uncharacterized protein n=1 Tax=Eumeta variegata TaxID=151549 RepID=A0A4C1WYZ7_EUMVA|nr:hypothetical protein EVAR_43068_1 [Eumeta japonica]